MPMLKPTGAIMFSCNGHSFTDVTCMYVCTYILGKKGCPDSKNFMDILWSDIITSFFKHYTIVICCQKLS